MAIGDRIRARRKARGWTEADFEKAAKIRSMIWDGIKTVASFVPVPGVAAAANAIDTAIDIVEEAAKDGTTLGKVAANIDTVDHLASVAVDRPDLPDFTAEVGDLLKSPITKLAVKMAAEIIDEIEERLGVDIPDELEKAVLDVCLDLMEDVYDQISDQGMNILRKAWEWLRGLIFSR